ncbi:inosine/xanthosine triphosphatase [Natronobiforma cellulositropha]|uniref:inosine/xanthosine triphosphatase n=1 Tax=Natronobiforma cellulositropha TaxID=1679076 RepID=UPI0021D5DA39|nr:inosine/xanthosine triphosphatase [Natronobiforma cellulositropha]
MHVALGSTNPAKRAAVERTLERFDPTVSTLAVDSGVAEQPRSVAETVDGSRTRATRAFAALESAAYGVGLESGVAALSGVPGDSLVMWAAVTDGERIEVGGGPSLPLPETVRARVERGEALGPVMDDLYGRSGLADGPGAIGLLTDGLLDRERALAAALACAFGPFLVDA